MSVKMLRNIHKDDTAWIVGKGPSLAYLRPDHFGSGPVIALNNAIIAVQNLDLKNKIYSLQKDGDADFMVEPEDHVTLILQDTPGYSVGWFQEHPNRMLVNPIRDLGFELVSEMAVRMAIRIAVLMGCKEITMVCCDSLTTGNMDTFDVDSGQSTRTSAGKYYEYVAPLVLSDLKHLQHEFSIPNRNGELK